MHMCRGRSAHAALLLGGLFGRFLLKLLLLESLKDGRTVVEASDGLPRRLRLGVSLPLYLVPKRRWWWWW